MSRITLALLLHILLVFGLKTASHAQDLDDPSKSISWPQFGGKNGDFQAEVAVDESGLTISEWSLELGAGDASPVFDRGQVYVAEAYVRDDGQDAMQVRCIDARDGSTIWKTLVAESSYISQDINQKYPVRPLASPILMGDCIVTVSFGGHVHCIRRETGTLVWQRDLVNEFQATPLQFGWASSPVSNPASDGKVVVLACGGPEAMVIALDLVSGALAWKSSPGEAAYGSFTKLEVSQGPIQLCYLGRDSLVGINPADGQELWRYDLPKPGVTNTVTPIALPNGELLVAGQGFESSRRYRVALKDEKWQLTELWKSRHVPFYCNWMVAPDSKQVISYCNGALRSIDLDSGELQWKTRGWTDANFAVSGETIIGIRGDGFLAYSKASTDDLVIEAGGRVVNDRVWAAPVLIGSHALIRGRNTLTSVNLDKLPKITKMPSGTEIDSMTTMYGKKHEQIQNLVAKAKSTPDRFTFEEYDAIAKDRAIDFAEGDYKELLDALAESASAELLLKIAEDWSIRAPESIAAFETYISMLEKSDHQVKASAELAARLVPVEIDVIVPPEEDANSSVNDTAKKLFLAGNSMSTGAWNPDGVRLDRSTDGHYRASVMIPKGNFEFKFTRGDWPSVEVRKDGRSTSNRRQVIKGPMTLNATVEAWSNTKQP